jgi:hypothetical protein
MVNLMLASHLSNLVSPEFCGKTIAVKPSSWPEFVEEVRTRFPRLANRVFGHRYTLNPGFALVLNDEVIAQGYNSLHFYNGDEMCILVNIAGG